MTFAIHRSGGTNAGHRRIKPAKTESWACECVDMEAFRSGFRTLNDPRLTRCPACGTRRP